MSSSGRHNSESDLIRQLLEHNSERLIAIADGILRDRHEAEDIVQETVTAVWQRLAAIAPDKIPHYLSRAVRQNALRKKSRRREFTALEELDSPTTSPHYIDPIDLEDAIESLPLPQQNVIRMKYYFGMTFRQIGVALSISTHTAGSRCRYALAKLRAMLTR